MNVHTSALDTFLTRKCFCFGRCLAWMVLASLWVCTGIAWAQITGTAAGKVTHLAGVLVAQKASGQSRILSNNSDVEAGDVLLTQDKAFARIRFTDGSNIVMRPNSKVSVDSYRYSEDKPEQDNAVIALLKGGLRTVTGQIGKRNPSNYTTTTVTATIGIRGTHYGLVICEGNCGDLMLPGNQPLPDGLHIDVRDGTINVSNPSGQIDVKAGEFAYVAPPPPGAPPPAPQVVPPENGIVVPIPPSMATRSGGGNTVGRAGSDNQCTIN